MYVCGCDSLGSFSLITSSSSSYDPVDDGDDDNDHQWWWFWWVKYVDYVSLYTIVVLFSLKKWSFKGKERKMPTERQKAKNKNKNKNRLHGTLQSLYCCYIITI